VIGVGGSFVVVWLVSPFVAPRAAVSEKALVSRPDNECGDFVTVACTM
jgi:hypothetical protein